MHVSKRGSSTGIGTVVAASRVSVVRPVSHETPPHSYHTTTSGLLLAMLRGWVPSSSLELLEEYRQTHGFNIVGLNALI